MCTVHRERNMERCFKESTTEPPSVKADEMIAFHNFHVRHQWTLNQNLLRQMNGTGIRSLWSPLQPCERCYHRSFRFFGT